LLREGDHVYVLSAVSYRKVVAELFGVRLPDEMVLAGEHEFSLDAKVATLGDLEDFYGLELGPGRDEPLAEWLDRTVTRGVKPGMRVPIGDGTGVHLIVVSVQNGRPHRVAVEFSPSTPAA
jgi:hypothetical protein